MPSVLGRQYLHKKLLMSSHRPLLQQMGPKTYPEIVSTALLRRRLMPVSAKPVSDCHCAKKSQWLPLLAALLPSFVEPGPHCAQKSQWMSQAARTHGRRNGC